MAKRTPQDEALLATAKMRNDALRHHKANIRAEMARLLKEKSATLESSRDLAVMEALAMGVRPAWISEELGISPVTVREIREKNADVAIEVDKNAPNIKARLSSEREGGVVPPGKTWIALDVNVDEYVEGEKSIPIRGVFLFNPSTREWVTNPGLLGIVNNPSEFMTASEAGNRYTGKLYAEFNVAAKKLITDNPDYKTYTEDN